MKYVAITMIVLVLVLTMFGFAAMDHSGGCAFSSNVSTDCPPISIDMALRHIAAYAGFTAVTISSQAVALILSVLILFAVFASLRWMRLHQSRILKPVFLHYRHRDGDDSYHKQSREIRRWLSLFENSPSEN